MQKMNRRTFFKSTAVITTALGFNIIDVKEPSYEFIRIVKPPKAEIWVIRPTDINNPVIPTHRLNLPYLPPSKTQIIHCKDKYGSDMFSYLKIGDYRRYVCDVFTPWDKVIDVGCTDDIWHWIETEKIFPYNFENVWDYAKFCKDISKDPKPSHQPT